MQRQSRHNLLPGRVICRPEKCLRFLQRRRRFGHWRLTGLPRRISAPYIAEVLHRLLFSITMVRLCSRLVSNPTFEDLRAVLVLCSSLARTVCLILYQHNICSPSGKARRLQFNLMLPRSFNPI
jgi:hypothetical protein